MKSETRVSSAISRRALVATGAGWVIGAAGLLLPASRDEAAARGALGGAMGGRHGKDHRGRNKHRENNKNERNSNDQHGQVVDQLLKDMTVTFYNFATPQAALKITDAGHTPDYSDAAYLNTNQYVTLTTAGTGGSEVLFYLNSQGHNFEVRVVNPLLGEPSVWILDHTTDTLVYDEDFDVNETFNSGLFSAQRNEDTADSKQFWLAVRDYF